MKEKYLVHKNLGPCKVIQELGDNVVLLALISNITSIVKINELNKHTRRLIDKSRAMAIDLDIIGSVELLNETWNSRYRRLMSVLESNDFNETLKAYGELQTLSKNKDLSFGERKLKASLREVLEKEIKLAMELG